MIDLNKLNEIVDYAFEDSELAVLAFSHSSYANENRNNRLLSYERLEFLGDAIIEMIVSEYLYTNYKDLSEGELTKIRAIVVCEPTFDKCSKKLELGQFLLLGKGEENMGGRSRTSILADIFESIAGAIYIDGGYTKVRNFVLGQLKAVICDAVSGNVFMDYKTGLQEKLQKRSNSNIAYSVITETGPDHNKEFQVQVTNNGVILGTGIGKSKKEAEQNAAKAAMKRK